MQVLCHAKIALLTQTMQEACLMDLSVMKAQVCQEYVMLFCLTVGIPAMLCNGGRPRQDLHAAS